MLRSSNKVVPLRIRGGMPDPVPVHNLFVGGPVGNAAAPPGAQTLGELEAEVIDLPLLIPQYASGAVARMARMQSVPLAQGNPFTKAEAPSQQFAPALCTHRGSVTSR